MPTSGPRAGEKIKAVRIDEDLLTVDLIDGRTVSVPVAWYPRLLHGSLEQRQNWELVGAGFGIHGPDLDEDISVHGMLAGAAAPGVRVAV
jgi:hypothetical protein